VPSHLSSRLVDLYTILQTKIKVGYEHLRGIYSNIQIKTCGAPYQRANTEALSLIHTQKKKKKKKRKKLRWLHNPAELILGGGGWARLRDRCFLFSGGIGRAGLSLRCLSLLLLTPALGLGLSSMVGLNLSFPKARDNTSHK
jgi:hypothetical protein